MINNQVGRYLLIKFKSGKKCIEFHCQNIILVHHKIKKNTVKLIKFGQYLILLVEVLNTRVYIYNVQYCGNSKSNRYNFIITI